MAHSGGDIGRSVFNKFNLFQKNQEYFPSGTGPSLALPDCPHGLGGPLHLWRRDQALRFYRDLGLIGMGTTCLSFSRRVREYHENQYKEVFNERN